MELRKLTIIRETVFAEGGGQAPRPITRLAGCASVANPFAGRFVEDLSPLFDLGHELGLRIMSELTPLLSNPAESYGKAAIVGQGGDLEHAHAMLHPKLGKPMREALGGGEAIIPSAAKIAGPGASLDVPLGHKDNVWSFDHFDAMTICVPDSPRLNEVLMVVAIADGGRPIPRAGKGRAVT